MTFGERLRELRKEACLSQRELAVMVEVDFTYISKLETGGTASPNAKTIGLMARALGIDEGELFALAGKVPIGGLENRITDLEAKHEQLGSDLDETRRLFEQHRHKQAEEGPLAPLAEVLAYHHKMVNGWAYLANKEVTVDDLERLHTEFRKMRGVVVQYEYTAQQLLGINPSPLADLEDEP